MRKNALLFLFFFVFRFFSAQDIVSTGAGGNFLIANYPGNFTGYYSGFELTFRSNHTIAGAATLSINGYAAQNIVNTAGNALVANDIISGQYVTLIYSSASAKFQMVSTSGNVAAGAAVAGIGTANYVTKWITAASVGNSQIFDDGINVGIGTNAPVALFHVEKAASTGTNAVAEIYNNTNASSIAVMAEGNGIGLQSSPTYYSRGKLAGYENISYMGAFNDYGVWGEAGAYGWGLIATNNDAGNENKYVAIAGPSGSPMLKVVDGTEGADKVLTSDASGNASWGSATAELYANSSTVYDNVTTNLAVVGTWMDIGALTQTITLSRAAKVLIMTYGGAQTTAAVATGFSNLDIQVMVDGTAPVNGCYQRLVCANTTGVTSAMIDRWAITSLKPLAAGIHTIKVQGRLNSGSTANVSSNNTGVRQGELVIVVIYQ